MIKWVNVALSYDNSEHVDENIKQMRNFLAISFESSSIKHVLNAGNAVSWVIRIIFLFVR
jgi:hypothetical protein